MGEALRRVLVVEDSDSDVVATTRILREYNAAVSILKDGFQAMEYLLNLSGGEALPDLVLLDLSLPGIHGLDVLRKLKAHEKTKGLRIVILTGIHEETMAMQCYKLNCDGVLMKPLTHESIGQLMTKFGLPRVE